MMKLKEKFFEDVYEESSNLRNYKESVRLKELLVSKLVNTIKLDAKGGEDKGPDVAGLLKTIKGFV
ncbi:MAG: hypothetical protein IJ727_02165 [Treponema sp.]|nr:hypothetical protein [Treponema sp.]